MCPADGCDNCSSDAREEAREEARAADAVNHPPHYNSGKIEVIEFLEDQQLEPNEWNAVKYISRARHKGREVQDLEKAIWYLARKIELLDAKAEGREPLRPNQMVNFKRVRK